MSVLYVLTTLHVCFACTHSPTCLCCLSSHPYMSVLLSVLKTLHVCVIVCPHIPICLCYCLSSKPYMSVLLCVLTALHVCVVVCPHSPTCSLYTIHSLIPVVLRGVGHRGGKRRHLHPATQYNLFCFLLMYTPPQHLPIPPPPPFPIPRNNPVYQALCRLLIYANAADQVAYHFLYHAGLLYISLNLQTHSSFVP